MSILLPEGCKRILVTGGAGFIGGALIRRLLHETDVFIYNLDKCGYASDLSSIGNHPRHQLIRVDLSDLAATSSALQAADPDLVMHLAAESHVDRSINGPLPFIQSNVLGTFSLLQAALSHWKQLPSKRHHAFRFHHISTDEVFGSLGPVGAFNETTSYSPRSPYSASKACSDHLVNAWYHTYGLPILITNCSNNYGPFQFPEKLIPLAILKALAREPIPLYGNGHNVRDWLYVEDHIEALTLVAARGRVGDSYCIGGACHHGVSSERTNKQVLEAICTLLDELSPIEHPYKYLITSVADRPGHDYRYSIDSTKLKSELGWEARHSFDQGLRTTVGWYIQNRTWCIKQLQRAKSKTNIISQ